MLYRTNSDGSREVHRLDLHDRNLLLSPYFNLQQNDFIYVEPNRSARQNAWQMHQGWTTSISIVSGLSSIAGLVIGIVNLSN
jgi:polysaccharide export outer membrane protein